MSGDRRLQDESSVERGLRELAPTIVYPPTPDLATSVRAALTDRGASRSPGFSWRLFRRSSLAALAALVLLAGAVLAVGMGLRGLSIVFVETPPPGASEELRLGERVALAEAQAQAPFRILLPTGEMQRPDEVYADVRAGIHQVTLVYRTSPGRDVELLITQFLARPELDAAVKQLGPGTSVETVSVGDQEGFWIAGEPHVLTYVDPSGRAIEDRIRLVGDVLVWQSGDLTLRLEGAGSREDAVEIAESME